MSVNPWDPFSPAVREPPAVLPTARLRRLGTPDVVVNAMARWWAEMGAADRKTWAAALAVTPDAELADDWSAFDDLADASVSSVAAWVEQHRTPVVAARVAMALERQRPGGPRKTLVSKLLEVSDG
jgi:hypothetical protein